MKVKFITAECFSPSNRLLNVKVIKYVISRLGYVKVLELEGQRTCRKSNTSEIIFIFKILQIKTCKFTKISLETFLCDCLLFT